MKAFITCLLLAALLGIIFAVSFAQQNQTSQKSNQDIGTPEERISVLESKLQTVENVEKMELAAKLADANAKLTNAEFSKFKNELRESNNQWLKSWSTWFLTVIGIFAAILIGVSAVFWFWLRSRADQLIADEVEKNLDGFKAAMVQVDRLQNQLAKASDQVNTLQNQIRILEKEHATSVLKNFIHYRPEHYPEQIKILPEQALLDVFSDNTHHLELNHKAAEVLAYKQSPRLISPALKFLNSIIDSDFDWEQNFRTQYYIGDLASFLGYIGSLEAYEGLKKFLERLLAENPEDKGKVLTPTAFSLAYISSQMNKEDSVSILKRAIPFLGTNLFREQDLSDLSEYFDKFNEPEGIKDILTNDLTNMMPEVETQCLKLLEQKYDPEFVEKWQAEKKTANAQNEESE